MPPHEKEKRFGDEGEKHGFNGIVDDDLSVVHQFGPAGFDAGKRVAGVGGYGLLPYFAISICVLMTVLFGIQNKIVETKVKTN